jgi:hypothetical protein
VSIVQPPAEDKGRPRPKPGGRPGTPSTGAGSGKPPSGNGRNGAGAGAGAGAQGRTQSGSGNRQGNQRNPSQKTAGNRQVTAKTVAQRPGDRAKQGPGRGGAQKGRPAGRAPVQVQGRRPSPTLLGLGAVFVVIVVVLVLVLVGTNRAAPKTEGGGATPLAPASLVAQVTGVPESVYAKVGLPSEISNYPKTFKGFPPLTDPGLPEMLYMGAEYCPFCGAERWAMVMALSKFGTFSGLKTTYSSATDFAADTPTFSFYGSTYTSQYLAFRPYELATNQPAATGAACNVNGYACLMTAPQSDLNLLESKAIAGTAAGSFPFMDFGNKLYQAGAGFEDQPLALQGYTYSGVASQLYDPSSAIAQAEVGSANYITAAICAITDNQPGSVCSAPYIKSAQKKAGIS